MTSSYKDITVRQSEFVTKTQFLYVTCDVWILTWIYTLILRDSEYTLIRHDIKLTLILRDSKFTLILRDSEFTLIRRDSKFTLIRREKTWKI